jgi:hypothetical protein
MLATCVGLAKLAPESRAPFVVTPRGLHDLLRKGG